MFIGRIAGTLALLAVMACACGKRQATSKDEAAGSNAAAGSSAESSAGSLAGGRVPKASGRTAAPSDQSNAGANEGSAEVPPALPAGPPQPDKILVAITVDWEGAYLSDDGLDMLDAVRRRLPAVPFTHFVSAAYFTKPAKQGGAQVPDPATEIKAQLKPGDELAVHVHVWRSLVTAAKVEPHLTPSFLTGKAKLIEFDDGDTGFDSDLDNYSVAEMRAIIATSRQLLTNAGLKPSTSFRAGGYLGTPKVLEAARAEGLVVDSSALDHRQLDEGPFRKRVAKVWPKIDAGTQPYTIKTQAGDILELPIAAFSEEVEKQELLDIVRRAKERLAAKPGGNEIVVFGFHQETAHEFVPQLLDALEKLRADADVGGRLQFVTIEAAAQARR